MSSSPSKKRQRTSDSQITEEQKNPQDVDEEEIAENPQDVDEEEIAENPQDVDEEQIAENPQDVDEEEIAENPQDVDEEEIAENPQDVDEEEIAENPQDVDEEEIAENPQDVDEEEIAENPQDVDEEEIAENPQDVDEEEIAENPQDVDEEEIAENPQDVDEEQLKCDDETDLQRALEGLDNTDEDKIQKYLRDKLPALSITSLDESARATIIDDLLSSEDGTSNPLAIHLAVQLFDSYFASLSDVGNALEARQVAACPLQIASKHFDDEQNQMLGGEHKGMEFKILNCVNFRLSIPSTLLLLDAFLSSTHPQLLTLVTQLANLALLDRDCSGFQIDVLAAGCIFLAQFLLDSNNVPVIRAPWECDPQQLRNAITILHQLYIGSRISQSRKFHTRLLLTFPTLRCPEIPDAYFL